MKFDVFLPSLLVPPDWFADVDPPRLPAIELLMARGESSVGGEWPNVLLPAFGVTANEGWQGIAAFSALGEAIETGDYGWMFAEPAHFQADRDTLNLIPASQLDITTSESAQLIVALNANFVDRGLMFVQGASGTYYVRCSVDELPQTTSIRAARRGALFEKLPQSRGKLSWKAIQNEAQMLLHSHAVNEAREANGKLTINGLWFWGEGTLPKTSTSLKPSIGAVFGDVALARGLAKWADVPIAAHAELKIVDIAAKSNHNVLVIDGLTNAFERGDTAAWCETAARLDAQIFAPLIASLREGTIDEVILCLPRDRDSLVITINSQSLRGLAGWWKDLTQKTHPFLELTIA